MKTSDFSIAFIVDQSPQEVYDAVNNVRGWWSEGIEGGTDKLNDEYVYRFKDLHYSKHKLVELVPGEKVVWLVTDGNLSFVDNKGEWIGTKLVFDITPKDDKTELRLTHVGLVPECECFDACSKGWTYYFTKSLYNLITTGIGKPNPTEADLKAQAVNN